MFNKLSKKSILVLLILKSINMTKLNNKINCRKILIIGEETLLLSENTPKIKTNKPNKINKIDYLKKSNKQMNIIRPPHKGGDFKVEFSNFL